MTTSLRNRNALPQKRLTGRSSLLFTETRWRAHALTTLYRLNDAEGNLLKWGITSRPNFLTRYSHDFLADKNLHTTRWVA